MAPLVVASLMLSACGAPAALAAPSAPAKGAVSGFDHIASDAVLESGGKTLLVDHQYVETEVVDDYTAVAKFAAPYPTFLRDAAHQWLSEQDYITAQRIIMENALVLALFTVNTTYLNAPSVQNFTFDVEGYPYIYNFSLSR